MIPWLLVAELLCVKGKPLSELVDERIARFPSSGEINLAVMMRRPCSGRLKRIMRRMRWRWIIPMGSASALPIGGSPAGV
ncbi:hypothetical protein ULF88_01645 [Halopseudomonas pachastrellae]|nr:hypothetical protein [Halopseudomonas pachastrellae]